MEIERLRRSKVKRNIFITLIAVLIITAIVLQFTRAKYRVTDTVSLVSGEVNYTPYDFKMIAIYQESGSGGYENIDTVPTSGYILNTEQSYCEVNDIKDNNITIDYQEGKINFLGMTTKGTKCYLYFDIDNTVTVQKLIASKSIDSSRSEAITGILTTDTTGTIYSVEDDWGTSYVYAGAPTDNWVSFAGYYWRIIRINGDGSIRMIYAGTSTSTSGTDDQIGTSSYNSSINDNAYVGYMYGFRSASSYSATHTNTNNSTIKGVLDTWYQNNLASYSEYINTEAGFCNDRQPMSGVMPGYGALGYGTNTTTYAPLARLMSNRSWKASQTPSLKCTNVNDLFTISESGKGNHELTYPIGLITSDEAVLAGGFGGAGNNGYYLYTNQAYWTMSPFNVVSGGSAVGFRVGSDGSLDFDYMNESRSVRPVINLRANVTLIGSGTSSNPYVVAL